MESLFLWQSFSEINPIKKFCQVIQKLRESISLDDSSYWLQIALSILKKSQAAWNDLHWSLRVPETVERQRIDFIRTGNDTCKGSTLRVPC